MSEPARAYVSIRDPKALLKSPPEFIELLPIAVYACDSEGRLRWYNRRAVELWGREPRVGEDGEPFAESFKLYDLKGQVLSRAERPMAEVLRTGKPIRDREAVFERPDGTRAYTMVHIDPLVDRNGTLVGAIKCFHDISELRRMRTQVEEGGAIVRQVLDALPAAIYTTDPKGRITYYNRAAVDLAGREPEIGKDDWCVTWKLYQPDGTLLPHDQCPMAITLKEDRPVRGVEAIAERPDGTRVPFMPYPTPLHDLSGNLAGAVNMLIDLSERKQAEAHQATLLAELNHRVKNNMMMLQALLTGARREAQSTEAREILEDAANRVSAMATAQQVLYSASDTHGFATQEFLRALAAAMQRMVGANVRIDAQADAGALPNDAAMPIALILNELVTNAVKHAVPEHGGLTVEIALTNDETHWQLQVRDNGSGFAYTPAGRRTSGLGLVNGLAAQLGGSLAVTRDDGAVCTIRFPSGLAR